MERISSFLSNPRNQAFLFILIISSSYYFLSSTQAIPKDIAVSNQIAYTASGEYGIRVVDSSNPDQLREIAIYNSDGDAKAVIYRDEKLFVADGGSGLLILDVSDPTSPREIAKIKTPNPAEDLAVVDDYGYVATGRGGLRTYFIRNLANLREIPDSHFSSRINQVTAGINAIFIVERNQNLIAMDISNPRKPIARGSIQVQTDIYDIFVHGNLAFLATEKRGLLILDVSDLNNLTELSQFQLGNQSINGVFVANKLAYITDGRNVRVLDISEINAIRQISTIPTRGTSSKLAVSEHKIYVCVGRQGLSVISEDIQLEPQLLGASGQQMTAEGITKSGLFAYLAAGESGLRILDVGDPQNPVSIGSYDSEGYSWNVEVSGDRAFLADGRGGLLVLDVSKPDEVGNAISRERVGSDTYDVKLSGAFAYLADGKDGFKVVQFSGPLTPTLISQTNLPGNAVGLAVLGDHAYIAAEDEGLRVVNISDPNMPALRGSYKIGGQAKAVAVTSYTGLSTQESDIDRVETLLESQTTNIYAYVAYGDRGLRIIDATDPLSLVEVGMLDLPGVMQDIAVVLDRVYIASSPGVVFVVDVADPSSPKLLGLTRSPGQAHGLAVELPVMYLADFERGLGTYDVSNPEQIISLGVYDAPSHVRHIAYKDDHVFLVDGQTGMWVMDVSDPESPTEVFFTKTDGLSSYVYVSANEVYLADGPAGLKIFDITNLRRPNLVGSSDTPGLALSVIASSNLAYLANGREGLRVLDVADKTNIREISSYKTAGDARRVAISREYIFIALEAGGLEIVKFVGAAPPEPVSRYTEAQFVRDLIIPANLAYLAAGLDGVQVIDVERPLQPEEVFSEVLPTTAEDLYTLNDYLFVASGSRGLRILDISDPTNPWEVGSSIDPRSALAVVATWQSPQAEPDTNLDDRKEPGRFIIYVADGDYGLRVYEARKSIQAVELGTITFRPTQLLILQVLFDILVMGVVGMFFWMGFFAIFVLPISTFEEWRKVFARLQFFLSGNHGPAVHIKNGLQIQHAGEEDRLGPGVALVDASSALVLERRSLPYSSIVRQYLRMRLYLKKFINRLLNQAQQVDNEPKVRVQGPGLVFTRYEGYPALPRWDERVRGVVDLRPQLRIRPEVHALTRDGIEVKTNISTVFTLGQPPEVLMVTYNGDQKAENIWVLDLKDDTMGNKVVKSLDDQLDPEDKKEIHRNIQSSQAAPLVTPPAPLTSAFKNYHFDPEQIFSAVYSEAQDPKDKSKMEWYDLSPHVATEVFRDLLSNEVYDSLYQPGKAEEYPLTKLREKLRLRVRNLGVLSYQYVRLQSDPPGATLPIITGNTYPASQFEYFAVQTLQHPKVLRTRGIKVIAAGFSELEPVEEGVHERLLENWRANWQKEAVIVKADHDLQASRIVNQARIQAQRDMVYVLSELFQTGPHAREALALSVFQALERVAADPATQQLLPTDTINALRHLRFSLLPDERGRTSRWLPEESS